MAGRYNIRVPSPHPHDDPRKQHWHKIYAAESTGFVIIALILLALILVRYWHNIHWSLR